MVAAGDSGVKRDDGSDQRRVRATRLARLVPALARKAYRTRGFASDEAVSRWREIVGADLADIAMPVRLRFRRGSHREGVLELKVEPAYATQIQHRSSQILERLNTYFGYQAVSNLRLIQAPVGDARMEASRQGEPVRAPDSSSQARAERLAKRVDDDKLRSVLRRWGAEILDSESS